MTSDEPRSPTLSGVAPHADCTCHSEVLSLLQGKESANFSFTVVRNDASWVVTVANRDSADVKPRAGSGESFKEAWRASGGLASSVMSSSSNEDRSSRCN